MDTDSHENENIVPDEKKTRSKRLNDPLADQQSRRCSNTTVPEVSNDENDEIIVNKESPSGGNYILRPNPTLISPMNTDTSLI